MNTWNIEKLTGYKPISNIYERFSLAEGFGNKTVKETYKAEFERCKADYKLLTEFVMCLNWKVFEHEKNEELAELYAGFWEKADSYACDHLQGEARKYFFETVD